MVIPRSHPACYLPILSAPGDVSTPTHWLGILTWMYPVGWIIVRRARATGWNVRLTISFYLHIFRANRASLWPPLFRSLGVYRLTGAKDRTFREVSAWQTPVDHVSTWNLAGTLCCYTRHCVRPFHSAELRLDGNNLQHGPSRRWQRWAVQRCCCLHPFRVRAQMQQDCDTFCNILSIVGELWIFR